MDDRKRRFILSPKRADDWHDIPTEKTDHDPIRAAAEEMFKAYMGYEPEEGWRCEERRQIDKICALVERERERIAGEIKEYFYSGEVVGYLLDRIRQGG